MMITKAYSHKIKPTKNQLSKMTDFAGASRFVWNFMRAACEYQYSEFGSFPGDFEQIKELQSYKQYDEYKWLKKAHAGMLQETIRELHRSYRRYFLERKRGKKVHKPGFRRKKTVNQTFTYPSGVKVNENKVYLPKIGWVKMLGSCEIHGEIKRATVKRTVSGWYVSILVSEEMEIADNPPAVNIPEVCVILSPDKAYLSTGEVFCLPKALKVANRRLVTLKQSLGNHRVGSRRWRKKKKRILRRHERAKNIRNDFLHKLSHYLTSNSQYILTVYSSDWEPYGDAGWSEFLRQMKYKSLWSQRDWCHAGVFPGETGVVGVKDFLNEFDRGVPVN